MIGLGGLVVIAFNRFGAQTLTDALISVLADLGGSDYGRVDQTAWIMRVFPDYINYTGWRNMVATLVSAIPRLQIPGTNSMWGYVIEYFYGGTNPYRGVGGINYATAAEAYSWGGFTSVIVFGVFSGVFYGTILEWQRRSPSNLFLKVYVTQTVVWNFFSGVQARLPAAIGATIFSLILVALMVALTLQNRQSLPLLLVLWFDSVGLFAWYGFRDLVDLDWLRFAVIASFPVLYVLSIRILHDAVPHQRAIPKSGLVSTRIRSDKIQRI